MGRDVDGTSLAVGTTVGEGSTFSGGRTRWRIWRDLGCLQKWMVGGNFRKLRMVGSEKRIWKPSWSISLSFGRPG